METRAETRSGRTTETAGTAEGWNDGLIARRAAARSSAGPGVGVLDDARTPQVEAYAPSPVPLRPRLDALRELVGLSRARIDAESLAEAGRVLDEAAARRRLSSRHTVVAVAGATGSGKSTLFNALAGAQLSETGLRRPTTSAPLACSWTDGAAGLLDRLAVPGRLRRRPQQGAAGGDEGLRGLVLVDLPDHDSAAAGHREQVDRVLALVDAVIWVVDPEKYADAALHERYLRPLAGHAEVTFVVLNQIDRLPGDAADQILDDLRRLLDEDGMALGEHGEPGATVLPVSALTGEGVGELRELLGRFVQERTAAARRLSADLDAAAARLRPLYVAEGRRPGLGEQAREEFADRLAEAVGAAAAGQAAEREWRRNAGRACGTPWLRLWRWYEATRRPGGAESQLRSAPPEERLTARQHVEHAVRILAAEAAGGLPAPWAQAVREAAVTGAEGLPEALDDLVERAGAAGGPGGAGSAGRAGRADELCASDEPRASYAPHAPWGVVEGEGDGVSGGVGGARGLRGALTGGTGASPGASGAPGVPGASGAAGAYADARGADDVGGAAGVGGTGGVGGAVGGVEAFRRADGAKAFWSSGGFGACRASRASRVFRAARASGRASGGACGGRTGGRPPRPRWWPAAVLAQASMTLLQVFGGLWLLGQIVGVLEPGFLAPALVMLAGIVGGPLVEWSCVAAARGPARRYGQEAERRLREAAASCGRARVLDPVAAELVRYREVRERYVAVTEFSTTAR
ncbi:GTPase [Streptomyces sp. PTD5-9]|uniref:GTPase n=1 Tax=Streptomyces sp. PTD5-9 TaxID=3120150 RepID=UPI00300B12FA